MSVLMMTPLSASRHSFARTDWSQGRTYWCQSSMPLLDRDYSSSGCILNLGSNIKLSVSCRSQLLILTVNKPLWHVTCVDGFPKFFYAFGA